MDDAVHETLLEHELGALKPGRQVLADRLPEELREVVAAKPKLAPQFLRCWKAGRISDDQVRRLIKGSRRAK